MHTRTATFSQKHVENLSPSQATLGNWMISVGVGSISSPPDHQGFQTGSKGSI